MNPNDPQQTPIEPTPNPNPTPAPSPVPIPGPVQPTAPPVKKSRKKLIIVAIISLLGLIFIVIPAIVIGSIFIASQQKDTASDSQRTIPESVSTRSDAEIKAKGIPGLFTSNDPKEVFFDNVSLQEKYYISYHDLTSDQTYFDKNKTVVDKIFKIGTDACADLKSGLFAESANALNPAVIATSEKSLCPEQRANLVAYVAQAGPSYKTQFDTSDSLVLDGTVPFEEIEFANVICFVTGSLYFGAPNDTIKTDEEVNDLIDASCLGLQGTFETDWEYVLWMKNDPTKLADALLKIAEHYNLATGVCTWLDCSEDSKAKKDAENTPGIQNGIKPFRNFES